MNNNQTKKAMEHLEILLRLNSCNSDYYKQILKANEVDMNDDEKVLEVLNYYEEVLPKSNTHTRLAIDLLKAGPAFEQKLIKFVRPLIIKGVPSTINDMRKLYQDADKAAAIGKVLQTMCDNMEKEMVLATDDEDEQDPTVQLWLYYFLSQHHLNLGNVDQALSFINKAIEHTPTVPELYTTKAKIFQFAGNRDQALKLTEEARTIDLQDRYLNAYSSKYMFKCNKVDEAHETMALFSKEIDGGNLNVHEMQTQWFEIHCGRAYYRLADNRQSLKQFNFMEKNFDIVIDDLIEFNNYAFRKGSILQVLGMVELYNNVYQGKAAVKCCAGVIGNVNKIQKYNDEKIAELKKQEEEWKASEDFKKWEKEYSEREDDDVFRYDPDPKGWNALFSAHD